MTGHEPAEPSDEAFAEFRASLEPLELSGKLRGILLQYHPRFVKSPEAMAELERVRPRLEPLVPLVEFRHRSWLEQDERADTFAFLERNGLAYVSVDAPRTRASNVVAAGRGRDAPGRLRPLPRSQREDVEHPLGEVVGPLRLDVLGRRSSRSGSTSSADCRPRPTRSTRSSTTTATTSRRAAPSILRGLLDEAGIPAAGGIEPPPLAPTLF